MRVAEVALEQRGEEHRQADQVREVARLAERAGEEDAQQVQHDRGDEDVRRPVVGLADQQPGLHVEREMQHGLGTRGSSCRPRSGSYEPWYTTCERESSKNSVR